ncbi:hypothetical protein F5Y05DRAFT_49107 [Hypoxylon sp. FL0543]|nr:hypothetical protein F5Y05DRAFT_49107 [Hypoxylon sp. FL0543]
MVQNTCPRQILPTFTLPPYCCPKSLVAQAVAQELDPLSKQMKREGKKNPCGIADRTRSGKTTMSSHDPERTQQLLCGRASARSSAYSIGGRPDEAVSDNSDVALEIFISIPRSVHHVSSCCSEYLEAYLSLEGDWANHRWSTSYPRLVLGPKWSFLQPQPSLIRQGLD